jgi:hypothetical protein
MAGPDDEQVERRLPPWRALRITEGQKRGRKMHGSTHVSGTYSWKKPGGTGGGVLVFEGGVIAPPAGGWDPRFHSPASLPAAVRLNDLRIAHPA